MALPTIVCLKSGYNFKFLRYREEEVRTHGLLQFSGDKVMDPLAQFEVVPATVNGGLVHLKSRYTNKYLVRWSPDQLWITASARKPNEDETSWACTLFKPIFMDSDSPTRIRLMHVQLGRYASLALGITQPPFDNCLLAKSENIDPSGVDMFLVTDWTALLNLPKKVAFKGDNGKYLGPFVANEISFLQFSFDNPNDPQVAHEIFTSFDGTVMIKSKHYGKFWRLGTDDWIVADHVDPNSGNTNTMFRVNFIDTNVVALLNLGKRLYCKRFTDAQPSLLKAATESVDGWAQLEVKVLAP